MKDYSSFFHMMNNNFVDEIQLSDFMTKTKKMTIHQLDPYSHFYTKKESERRKQTWKGISYAGIGAMIKQTQKGVAIDYCKKGYGAELSGLLPGDVFIKVDSIECKNFNLQQVIKLLKGEEGTTLKVLVQRGDVAIEAEIKRKNIISRSISFADTISKDIGLIKVDQFLRGSASAFRENIQQIIDNGATKIILDFRGNIGGLVNEAVNSLSVFFKKGTIIYELKSKNKKSDYSDSTKQNPISTSIPLVILIDSKTISSGEIFTGAIQDLDRGVLMGQKSYGKGLVQGTRYFKDGSSLYITAARYHLPSGRCIQKTDYRKNYNKKTSNQQNVDNTIYKSQNGRVFNSGDGISPDKYLSVLSPKPELIKSIERSTLPFEFAILTRRKYGNELFNNWNEIAKEWNLFVLSNSEKLTTSIEGKLNKLREEVDNDPAVFRKTKKISKKLDQQKKKRIKKEAVEIAEILYEKLILYDHFKEGLYKYKAKKDPWVDKAIELLNSKEEYIQILQGI
mgnify:CR=1 FL=1